MAGFFWISYVLLWVLVGIIGVSISWLIRLYAAGVVGDGHALSLLGPSVGERAPVGSVRAGIVDLPRLMVFLSTDCTPCQRVLPLVRRLTEDYESKVDVTVVCQGPEAGVVAFATALGSRVRVVPDSDVSISGAWRVSLTPFVVGVSSDGRVLGKTGRVQGHDLHNLLLSLLQPSSVEGQSPPNAGRAKALSTS